MQNLAGKILGQLKEEFGYQYQSKLITTHFTDALNFGVKSAPTLVYVVDDKAFAVTPGLQSREKILAVIARLKKSSGESESQNR